MDKKVLKWNFIFQYGYVITNIINAFLLLPFYVGYINEVELGLWWATGNVLTWLTMTDPGIGDVLQQRIAALFGKNELNEISKTVGSGLIASLFTFVISIGLGLIFYLFLDDLLGIKRNEFQNLKTAFLISILATGATLVTFALSGINQGLLRAKHVAFAYITGNLIYLAANIIFLTADYGVMSIAYSNLIRAVYLIFFNVTVIFFVKSNLKNVIILNWEHFKGFIRIFSYTAVSRVISSFSGNLDLILLPRFVSPHLITLFEINRRPIKMLQGLIGRYSVALMPIISHTYGHNIEETNRLILKQFELFSIAVLASSGLSILCYEQLISLWINDDKLADLQITILLVLNFLFGLIGYFFSNVTYAIGDIKNNSTVNSLKGASMLILLPFGAWINGIIGVLTSTLVVTVYLDFGMFLYRILKLKILVVDKKLMYNWLAIFCVVIVSLLFTFYLFNFYIVLPLFFKMLFNAATFTVLVLAGLYLFTTSFPFKLRKI